MVVVFEETGEEREVTGYCSTCCTDEHRPVNLVSPSGMVHEGRDYGVTWCGRDATGDGWWWKT